MSPKPIAAAPTKPKQSTMEGYRTAPLGPDGATAVPKVAGSLKDHGLTKEIQIEAHNTSPVGKIIAKPSPKNETKSSKGKKADKNQAKRNAIPSSEEDDEPEAEAEKADGGGMMTLR